MTTRALVVGAGPAGLAAAIGLAEWCGSVTVIDAGPRVRSRRVGEHLPPTAVATVVRLGFGTLLDDPRHEVSPGVRSAWGTARAEDKEYFTALPGWGLNLDRPRFDEALAQMAEAKGASLRHRTRLLGLHRVRDGVEATLQDAARRDQVRFDLAIDASGRSAVASRFLGTVPWRGEALVGLQGRIEGCAPLEEPGRIQVESVEDGWWYGVQFADGTLLATFMTDIGVVRDHSGTARALWEARLRQSALLSPLAGTGRWDGRLAAHDAATQSTADGDRPDFLAVGDAATAYDPLASWGIAKGLSDGHAAATALREACAGSGGALARWRAARRRAFHEHRARQQEFYRAETRWPASPFWRARSHPPQAQAS